MTTPVLSIAIPFKDRPGHLIENLCLCIPQLNEKVALYLVDNSSDPIEPSIQSLLSCSHIIYVRTGGLNMADNWSVAFTRLKSSNSQYSLVLEDKTYLTLGAINRLLGYITQFNQPDFIAWNSSIYNKSSGKSKHIRQQDVLLSQGGAFDCPINQLISSRSLIHSIRDSVLSQGLMSRYLRAFPRDCSLIKTSLLPDGIPSNVNIPDYYLGLKVISIAESFVVLDDSLTQAIYSDGFMYGNGGLTMRKQSVNSISAKSGAFLSVLNSSYSTVFGYRTSPSYFDEINHFINVLIFSDFLTFAPYLYPSSHNSTLQSMFFGFIKELAYRIRLGASMKKEWISLLRIYSPFQIFTLSLRLFAHPRDLFWLTKHLVISFSLHVLHIKRIKTPKSI